MEKRRGSFCPVYFPDRRSLVPPSRRRRRSGRMLLYRFSATDKTSPRGG
jgi:hypothetical protein